MSVPNHPAPSSPSGSREGEFLAYPDPLGASPFLPQRGGPGGADRRPRLLLPGLLALLPILACLLLFSAPARAATRAELFLRIADRLNLPESSGPLPPDVAPSAAAAGHLRFAARSGLIDPALPFAPDATATRGDALRLVLAAAGWSFEATLVDRLSGTPPEDPPAILRAMSPPPPAFLLASPRSAFEESDWSPLEAWISACEAGMGYEGRFGWEGLDLSLIRRGIGRPGEIWGTPPEGALSADPGDTPAPSRRYASSKDALAADPILGPRAVRLPVPPAQCLYLAVLRVDPARFRPRITFASSLGAPRAPLSVIARSSDALAAVNGGFFSGEHPIGTLALSGDPLGRPHPARGAFGIGKDGSVFFSPGAARFALRTGTGLLELTHYGAPPDADGVSLYSPHRAPFARGIAPDALELLLRDGRIVAIQEAALSDHAVPEEGLLLVARGRSRRVLETLRVGDALPLASDYVSPILGTCPLVLQAGPMLLENGKPVRRDEKFQPALLDKRHPRTFVGIDGRHLVLVAVDGRNSFHSVGATMEETRNLALQLGCFAALALDGGGSTGLWFYGGPANLSSEVRERPLPYALTFPGPPP